MLIAQAVFRREVVEGLPVISVDTPTGRTEPQTPCPVLEHGPDRLTGRAHWRQERREGAPIVPAHSPIPGPEPEVPLPVLKNGADIVAAQSVPGGVRDHGTSAVFDDPRAIRAEPKASRSVLVDAPDEFRREPGVVSGTQERQRKPREALPVVAADPSHGADPQVAGAVLLQAPEITMAQAVSLTKAGEELAVIATESPVGGEPEDSILVFQYAPNGITTETVLCREVDEGRAVISTDAVGAEPEVSVTVLEYPANVLTDLNRRLLDLCGVVWIDKRLDDRGRRGLARLDRPDGVLMDRWRGRTRRCKDDHRREYQDVVDVSLLPNRSVSGERAQRSEGRCT